MGSSMYGGWYPQQSNGTYGPYGSYYPAYQAPAVAGSLSACTCGPYSSIIPPEPCPIHDPEKAYWRRKLLAEFGGHETKTTTNTASVVRDFPKPGTKLMHYMEKEEGTLLRYPLCQSEAGAWTRVEDWVTCKVCKDKMEKSDGR